MASQMIIPASKDTLFFRNFLGNQSQDDIREYFKKEARSSVSIEFFKRSEMDDRLYIALRFESREIAKDILNRFDGADVLGDRVQVSWFKDLRKAKAKGYVPGRYSGNWNNHRGGDNLYRARDWDEKYYRDHGRHDYRDDYRDRGYRGRGGGGGGRVRRHSSSDRYRSERQHKSYDRSASRSSSRSRSRTPDRGSRDRSHSRSRSSTPPPKKEKKRKSKSRSERHELKSTVRAASPKSSDRGRSNSRGRSNDRDDSVDRKSRDSSRSDKDRDRYSDYSREDDKGSVERRSRSHSPPTRGNSPPPKRERNERKVRNGMDLDDGERRLVSMEDKEDEDSRRKSEPPATPSGGAFANDLLAANTGEMDWSEKQPETRIDGKAPEDSRLLPPSLNGTLNKEIEKTGYGLSMDKLAILREKKEDIEKAYRNDCETFATVVKMLISKDPLLEDKLQMSLRENLKDIGQRCIYELREYIERVRIDDN